MKTIYVVLKNVIEDFRSPRVRDLLLERGEKIEEGPLMSWNLDLLFNEINKLKEKDPCEIAAIIKEVATGFLLEGVYFEASGEETTSDDTDNEEGIPPDHKLPRMYEKKPIDFDVMKFLVDKGGNVHAENDSFIKMVINSKCYKMVKFLTENISDSSHWDNYLATLPVDNGDIDIVRLLVDRVCCPFSAKSSNNLLEIAARKRNVDMAWLLVGMGADVRNCGDAAVRWLRKMKIIRGWGYLVEKGFWIAAYLFMAVGIAASVVFAMGVLTFN